MKFLKNLNQNFLINYSYLDIISNFVKPELNIIYIEIGFGDGNLSKNIILKLLFYNFLLYFIEIDKYFFYKFSKNYSINILNLNILNLNFFFLKKFFFYKFKLFIIGNIAYKISTYLLCYLIKFIKYINNQYLMLENEYFEKIINDKIILSFFIKSFYKIKKIFFINNSSFFPKPKINSVFVNFKPLYLTLINSNDFYFFKKFLQIIIKEKKLIKNFIIDYDYSKKMILKNYILMFFKFKKKFLKF